MYSTSYRNTFPPTNETTPDILQSSPVPKHYYSCIFKHHSVHACSLYHPVSSICTLLRSNALGSFAQNIEQTNSCTAHTGSCELFLPFTLWFFFRLLLWFFPIPVPISIPISLSVLPPRFPLPFSRHIGTVRILLLLHPNRVPLGTSRAPYRTRRPIIDA